MLYFLFGGSASGKSEYAEQLAVRIFESDRVTTADEDPLSSMRRMTTADEDPLSSMRRMTTADREPPSSMRRMTEADEEPLSDMSHGLLYIATMKNDSEEAARRIRRHREQRRGRGFDLCEVQTLDDLRNVPEAQTILFDCLSNFSANVMFSQEFFLNFKEKEPFSKQQAQDDNVEMLAEKIAAGMKGLEEKCRHLVVVADAVFSDGIVYDDLTNRYIRLLGRIFQKLCAEADAVVEVVYGLPMRIV